MNLPLEERAMSHASRLIRRFLQRCVPVFAAVAVGVLALSAVRLSAEGGSPGPLAQSCGVPPAATSGSQAGGSRELPQFPPGQYPVKLPSVRTFL